MVQYDPTVIHQHVQRLYDRALGIVVIYGVASGILGLGVGAALGSTLDELQTASAIVAAAMFGTLGVLRGQARGFELRLQAQTALCQVQIELNTRLRSAPAHPPIHAQPPQPQHPPPPIR